MSDEGSIVGHFGACGSGKTFRLKARVAAAVRCGWPGRVVVLDVRQEWPRADDAPELGPLLSGSAVPMARAHVPRLDAPGAAVVICRPRTTDPKEVRDWADRCIRAALEARGVLVVAPEVWRYAREHERMTPALEQLAHEHRHARASLWFDAQSFPEVSKELLRRAGWLCIHGTGAHEDLRRLEAIGGPHLAAAVLEAQRRNVRGAPGHHVWFRAADPMPPFRLLGPDGSELATFGPAAPALSGSVRARRPK